MRNTAAAGILGAAIVGIAFLLQASAEAQTPRSRVIDRTLRCTTAVHAGIRKLTVFASSAQRGQKDHQGGPARPYARVSTGSAFDTADVLAGMVGGAPTRLFSGATLWIGTSKCAAGTARVMLSARGLVGGQASFFGDAANCIPPKRVDVRVRGVFRSPTRLRRSSRDTLSTGATLREGSLAVRTESGKPLVYAEVFESGKARLFTAPSCPAD